MHRPWLAALLLPSLLLVAACTPGADLKPLAAVQQASYRLGAGDQIRMLTYGEDALSEIFRVNAEGNISVPLLGDVHAAGLTTDQLATEVSHILSQRDLMKGAVIAVEVVAYRPVFVLGEVNKPGPYPYQPGMTVQQAAAMAGGYTYRAFKPYAEVTRREHGHAVEGRLPPLAPVLPNDTITILERYF
ncbi:MAG: polysaccharide export protein [Rhodospirillales bacterium]|nr:polysaccharide export protein [Rhodospirillales bacterium]